MLLSGLHCYWLPQVLFLIQLTITDIRIPRTAVKIVCFLLNIYSFNCRCKCGPKSFSTRTLINSDQNVYNFLVSEMYFFLVTYQIYMSLFKPLNFLPTSAVRLKFSCHVFFTKSIPRFPNEKFPGSLVMGSKPYLFVMITRVKVEFEAAETLKKKN